MIDLEKITKGLTVCSEHGTLCNRDCHGYYQWIGSDEEMLIDAYSDQCPYNGNLRDGCLQTLVKDIFALLKEREPVKPVLDEQTGRIWLCGNCGSYVGFEDNDEYDPNEYDKFCRECGKRVLWERIGEVND